MASSASRAPESKAALRAALLTQRSTLDSGALAAAAAAVAAHLLAAEAVSEAGVVAAYVPLGGEPGSLALLDDLTRAGTRVLLPLLLPDRDLDWAVYEGADTLTTGAYGLREPSGARLGVDAVATVDVALVPALAVDRSGRRLGRGGGSYDRALARVRTGRPVVALLHDGELLERVPAEPHDRPVTAAVTPTGGLVRIGRPATRHRH